MQENLSNLELCFDKTSGSNIENNSKKYSNNDLFSFSKKFEISSIMRNQAKKEINKYFPGKDIAKLIAKLKTNFKVESYLKKLDLSEYPEELSNYLQEIKEFFSN